MTRGKGGRPFGEHVGDLVPFYFAEITSLPAALKMAVSKPVGVGHGCQRPAHPLAPGKLQFSA